MRPLKVLQRHITNQKGQIDDASNPYQKEEFWRKKAQNRLKVFHNKFVKPLVRISKKYKITLEEIVEYLQARHTPERNRELSKLHRKRNVYAGRQKSTGMLWTDEYANQYVASVEASKKGEAMKKIAAIHDKINQFTRDTWLEAGLVPDAAIKAMENKYQYYTPLISDLNEKADAPFSGIGMGLQVKGKEFRAATGRKSAAGSSLVFAITAAQTAIVRAEKAKVGQAFYKLVQENPNPDLWQIDKPAQKLTIGKDGRIKTAYDPTMIYRDNVFAVKIDGVVHHITINDPKYYDVARALKNLDVTQQGDFMKGLASVNRYLSSMSTRWNPVFPIVNVARDIGSASITLTGEKGAIEAAKVVAKLPFAMRAIWRGLRTSNLKRNELGTRSGTSSLKSTMIAAHKLLFLTYKTTNQLRKIFSVNYRRCQNQASKRRYITYLKHCRFMLISQRT